MTATTTTTALSKRNPPRCAVPRNRWRAPTCAKAEVTVTPSADAARAPPSEPLTNPHDVLHTVCTKLGLERTIQIPVAAHNQEGHDRCVAASVCLGMYLRVAVQAQNRATCTLLRQPAHLPSVVYAYQTQCRQECIGTGRCDCGSLCGGVCDPRCGSIISVMLQVCRRGVPLEKEWPLSAALRPEYAEAAQSGRFFRGKPYFRLSRYRVLRVRDDACTGRRVVRLLKAHIPCVLNMFVYPNQETFMHLQNQPDVRGESVFSSLHTMPNGTGCRSEMGHCVLAVGVDPTEAYVRVRNSFGPSWGFDGDFAVPVGFLTRRHVHAVVALEEVSAHGFPLLEESTAA